MFAVLLGDVESPAVTGKLTNYSQSETTDTLDLAQGSGGPNAINSINAVGLGFHYKPWGVGTVIVISFAIEEGSILFSCVKWHKEF